MPLDLTTSLRKYIWAKRNMLRQSWESNQLNIECEKFYMFSDTDPSTIGIKKGDRR